jgi:hypothetical protein
MAKSGTPSPPEAPQLSPAQMRGAISRFQRRVDELEAFDPEKVEDRTDPKIAALAAAIDEALSEAFGFRTPAYVRYRAAATLDTAPHNYAYPPSRHEIISGLRKGKARAIVLLNQAIRSFEEKLADLGEQPNDHDATAKTLRAYEGLDLHPAIARATNDLYRNGHYANAIEDSVKALNHFSSLMQRHARRRRIPHGDGFQPQKTNSPFQRSTGPIGSRRTKRLHDDVQRRRRRSPQSARAPAY